MIEIERDENRVVLHRGFLDDPRLSLRAKGLLAVLLAGCDTNADLESLAVAGERPGDVLATLRELESAGYFQRAASGADNALSVTGRLRETSALPLLEPLPKGAPVGHRGDAERSAGNDEAEVSASERVLAKLNELRQTSWTWARYTPLSARHAKNVEHIKGRMREGYAEADLILVLEYLAVVDAGKDESRRFFDSVTPFNTKNFERNLAMARDWEARGRPRGDGSLSLQRADGHDPAIYERRVKGGGT